MSGQGKHKNLQLAQWLRNPWVRCDNVERGPIPEWQAALMFEAANVIEHLETTRTPDPAQIRADAIREAAAIARDHTPEKHSGMTLASHVTGRAIETALLALLDTPLSPTAVDGSIAPNADMKGQDQ